MIVVNAKKNDPITCEEGPDVGCWDTEKAKSEATAQTRGTFSFVTGCFLSSAVRPGALRLRPRPGSRRPLQGSGRGLRVGRRPPDCERGGRGLVAGLSPERRPQSRGDRPLAPASPEVGDRDPINVCVESPRLLFLSETGELRCSAPKPSSDLAQSNRQVTRPNSKPLAALRAAASTHLSFLFSTCATDEKEGTHTSLHCLCEDIQRPNTLSSP